MLMSVQALPTNDKPAAAEGEPTWNNIQDALRGLQFGSVTLIVQDGLIVQIDRLERRRLPRSTKK
jgi:hypothetical protein